MRLFIFESNTNTGLRAFVGDVAGRNLPDQFSPGDRLVRSRPGALLLTVSRDTIKKATSADGFQLWRVKAKVAN
jgi:hypothetical protein